MTTSNQIFLPESDGRILNAFDFDFESLSATEAKWLYEEAWVFLNPKARKTMPAEISEFRELGGQNMDVYDLLPMLFGCLQAQRPTRTIAELVEIYRRVDYFDSWQVDDQRWEQYL